MKPNTIDFKPFINSIHHKSDWIENISTSNKNYPLGSMPRKDNSFLMSRFIHADIFPSPSCSTANSIALRSSGSNLNWNGGLPLREDFLSLCIDTLLSPVYIIYVSIHNTHTFTNKQASEVLPALTEALITHLLKRSKSMTDYNSTPYTAIGVSKIHSINGIHHKSDERENFSHAKAFTDLTLLGYAFPVVAKSTTEPRNSNINQLANSSTPSNRAFFVRSIRTPKENVISIILSMVACNGKGSPFAVFQLKQFSSPLHVTAQTLESLAVALNKLQLELSAMIYKFLLLGSQRLKITVRANNKAEALSKVKFNSKPLLIARLQTPIVSISNVMEVQYA